jgi:KUP system potassium uptake protein
LLLLGVFGATLFYGDSMITPAISVLGAMEGLSSRHAGAEAVRAADHGADPGGLFPCSASARPSSGRWFGPVIVLWFVCWRHGCRQIAQQPAILAALNPLQAWPSWPSAAGMCSLRWGRSCWPSPAPRPCMPTWATSAAGRSSWPGPGWCCRALALNYLGQGALLMADPSAIENPFYRLFPEAWVLPALVLATLAAIIASQAVISGAYSMTKQAIQLGFLPRMTVRYTSAREASGQIYMPR